MNLPNVNGAPNNPAMMAALQAGSGMQSPSLHNAMPQGVSTPSPRMGQPNLLSGGVVPTISSIQNQIQRSNPNMPPEQVNKLATDRLHQYQQQRMSQVAMNAAAGNMASVQANYQVPHDGNFQSPQPGINGGPGMQVPQSQGFSPMMRVPQPAQQNRMGVGNSPAMNSALPQQSRSATPQTQRSGSAQAGPVPGSSKSPHPPQAQIPSG
jgi:chromatin modification-related protein VID21